MLILEKLGPYNQHLSIEEWMVLMDYQNSSIERVVAVTVWDTIRVCIEMFSILLHLSLN
jgi:hypothetical protein